MILSNYQDLTKNMSIFIEKIYAQQPFQAKYDSWQDQLNLKTSLKNATLGEIISFLLPYLLTIAGLVLFAMLVAGAFTLLAGATNKENQEKGKKMVTSALTGFFVIFLAFWIAQILQVIFKINIVS